MKKIFTFLSFFLFLFTSITYSQDFDFSEKIPYQIKERIVLEDNIKNINLRDYYLCDYGDSIIVFAQEKIKKDIWFHFQVYAKNGIRGSLKSFPLKKQEKDYLKKRYTVKDMAFSTNHLYLLFSYQLWVLPFSENKDSYFKIFPIEEPYNNITSTRNGLVLQRVSLNYDHVNVKDKVAFAEIRTVDNSYVEKTIDAYTPDNYFLMLFESRKYYDIDPNGKFIVKLYNDKPEFDILDMEGNVILTHKMDIPWQYFDEEEIPVLNKKADKDPNEVFSALHERFWNEVFVNTRVDCIDSGKFLITQILHRENENHPDSLDFNPEAILYEYIDDEVRYIKTYPANPHRNQNDGRFFSFSNSFFESFFFKDSYRYQIGIFPSFDDSLSDENEIKQQQEDSFLSNRFQLCLYIGELRP